MAVDYQQQFQDSIVGTMMPNLNRQKKGMYDFLLQNALRTGQSATSVAEGLRPYAEASGQAAAEAGVAATGMARRATEFDKQETLSRDRMAQQNTQWQQSFDQRNTQQNMINMMSLFQQTGTMTPEMMEQFGFGDMTRSQQRDIQSQMEMLGMGGQGGGGKFGGWEPGKNPAVDRMRSYNPSSGGASNRSISTPSDPFRRVTGPNQGPGLMSVQDRNDAKPRNSSGYIV
jgi:hypothetical protein